MARHAFLSPEWIAAARTLHSETGNEDGNAPTTIRMNLVITEVPFADASVDAHVDTSSGDLEIDLGHLESPDVKVVLDYLTAKAILVEGKAHAGMQAFMAGRVRIEGDMTRLLAFQSGPSGGRQASMTDKIREITA